jgi:predicted enzyme related to lactoylglutathione lyase
MTGSREATSASYFPGRSAQPDERWLTESGGWNRIHLIVEDIKTESARLRVNGVQFRNEIVTGPGGKQVLALDPSRNLIELFQPAPA